MICRKNEKVLLYQCHDFHPDSKDRRQTIPKTMSEFLNMQKFAIRIVYKPTFAYMLPYSEIGRIQMLPTNIAPRIFNLLRRHSNISVPMLQTNQNNTTIISSSRSPLLIHNQHHTLRIGTNNLHNLSTNHFALFIKVIPFHHAKIGIIINVQVRIDILQNLDKALVVEVNIMHELLHPLLLELVWGP